MSRRAWLGAGALAALGLGAAGVATATPGWLGHARHGFGHFGPHGRHGFDAEDLRYVVERQLREVDASEEQIARVAAIASQAHGELHALADAHKGRHDDVTRALVSADRAALEQLRRDALATADEASQRLVAALADAAELLRPEQRERLAALHAERHGRE
jgi:Spy/CpxP family protein refolding chaperone